MPDPTLIFTGGNYVATGLSVATAISAAITLAIGFAILVRGRESSISTVFFLITILSAFWLTCFSMMYASENAVVALWWARASRLPIGLLPAAAFHFAALQSAGRRTLRVTTRMAWVVGGGIGLVAATTPFFVANVTRRAWGYFPVQGPAATAFGLFAAVLVIPAVLLLLGAYKESEGQAKERAGALLLAFLLGSVGFIDFLPAAGIEIYPVAYTSVFAFVIVAAAAVWRYQLVDLTPGYAASQILDTMKSAVLLVDMEGTIRVVNFAAANMLGYAHADLVGHPLKKILDVDESTSTKRLLNSTGVLEQQMGWRSATNAHVDVLCSSSFVRDVDGAPVGVVYVASDFTERKRAEQRLRDSEARYRNLFERNLAGVYRTAVDGRVLDCNDAFARMFGYESRQDMLQHSAHSLYFDNDDRERILNLLREQKTLMNLEARLRRKDDTPIWVLENMSLLEQDGQPGVIEGTIIDITDRKAALEKIEYQAYHDVLTGLPNRLLFRDRIAPALAHARRTSCTAAVLFFDLDEFKAVNDRLGHTVGDRLLQVIATRLGHSIRSEDTVARMGGDEFTVLLADVGDGRGATTVARKILEAIQEPVKVDEHVLRVTTSIGIALYPGDGFDAEALLKSADRAMYRAKQLGKNNYQYATPPPFDERLSLERRLRDAVEKNEFVLHYQPIVEIATGKLVGAEALLRWNDPAGGLLEPRSFMEAAQESEIMPVLGEWVLRTASEQMKRWHDMGHQSLRLSVNFSARQFHLREMPEMVRQVLAATRLPMSALDIEITEATVMLNPDLALGVMRELKQMGVHISIDDFGTGYSSISYLRRLPIDTVKIDREFVCDLVSDSDSRAIISAVLSMARHLDLRVVAEGVETGEQLEFLKREKCAEMQGYIHSRPVAAAAFEREMLTRFAEVDIETARREHPPVS